MSPSFNAADVTLTIAGIEIDGRTFERSSPVAPFTCSATCEATVTIESKQWRKLKRALGAPARIPLGRLGGRRAHATPRMTRFARAIWNAIGRPR
jgi:hypothetical protein